MSQVLEAGTRPVLCGWQGLLFGEVSGASPPFLGACRKGQTILPGPGVVGPRWWSVGIPPGSSCSSWAAGCSHLAGPCSPSADSRLGALPAPTEDWKGPLGGAHGYLCVVRPPPYTHPISSS